MVHALCSAVPGENAEKTQEVITGLTEQELAGAIIDRDDDIAKLSIVGEGMRTHAGVAAQMFEILGAEGINIKMITTSEIKISVAIDQKYSELATRVLHEAFLES